MGVSTELSPEEARLFEEFSLAVNAIESETYEKQIKPEIQAFLERNLSRTNEALNQFKREIKTELDKTRKLLYLMLLIALINGAALIFLIIKGWH